MSVANEVMPAHLQIADVKRALIEELLALANGSSSMERLTAASAIKTTAVLDLRCAVTKLPVPIWQLYHRLNSRGTGIVSVSEDQRGMNSVLFHRGVPGMSRHP